MVREAAGETGETSQDSASREPAVGATWAILEAAAAGGAAYDDNLVSVYCAHNLLLYFHD